jgi:hypothetical protein
MSEFDEYREDWSARWRSLAIPVAILAIVVGAIFYFLHDTAGVRREAPPLPVLTMLPPPPPPPPKPPEPEKKIEEAQKPIDQPKQQQPVDAPRPITINGPAQAGTDAFNVGAGSGGGSMGSGGGFGEANYGRYLGSVLQQAIQNDERVNRQVFSADMAVWVDPTGRVTRAKVLKTSGDPKLDMDLVAALEGMPALDESPPSTLLFPQRVRIDGRRPA